MATFDASVGKNNVAFGLKWASEVAFGLKWASEVASARRFFALLKLSSQTTVQLLTSFVLFFFNLVDKSCNGSRISVKFGTKRW